MSQLFEPKMPNTNKIDFKALILRLLTVQETISLPEIAQAAGVDPKSATDRRAIQRGLVKLIEAGEIQPQGQARARVYLRAVRPVSYQVQENPPPPYMIDTVFNSNEALELLEYFSQPAQARKIVSYNQEFLRSYIPNKTEYLSSASRQELLEIGTAENIIQPAGTYARSILNRLLIDLSWNSSRLEGNTYSLLETKRLIELGEIAVGKNAIEAQMILNHKAAIEYLIESVDQPKISAHEIHSIHALLSENLLGDPSASGAIRKIAVGISGTTYLPLENHLLLKECFELFLKKINLITDPFEQSFFALVHLSYLQAFEDVNKRTSRLVTNIPLIKKNLKPLSFIDVDQKNYLIALLGIYEKNDISLLRDLYIWAYKRSAQRYSAVQQAMGEPNLFKLKYRSTIQEIVRTIILEKTKGSEVVTALHQLIEALNLPETDAKQLFQVLETEIISLHDGNIARFKIRPSEFRAWTNGQGD